MNMIVRFIEGTTKVELEVGPVTPEFAREFINSKMSKVEIIEKVYDNHYEVTALTNQTEPQEHPNTLERVSLSGTGMTTLNKLLPHRVTPVELIKIDSIVNDEFEDIPNTRIVDGKRVYRAEYTCAGCQKIGRKYVWKTSDFLKCHVCDSKLTVVPSLPDVSNSGEPIMDLGGNYFYASELHN